MLSLKGFAYFFVCINVATFAIAVWRFSPHCVVKFTTVYSTVWKQNSMEVDSVGIISILSMSYITTRVVKTSTSMAKISRAPVENQITTLSVVKITIKFFPCGMYQKY